MANHYKNTDIIPPGRKRADQAIPTTSILPDLDEPKQHLGGFAPTRNLFPKDDERTAIEAEYKVVLSDHKDFEVVILDHAKSRKEAYDAYKAWQIEYNANPLVEYPPDVWVVCTRNGELSWKTSPFVR